jgi:hypothetical protein
MSTATKKPRQKVGFLLNAALDPQNKGPLDHPLTLPASSAVPTRKKVPMPKMTTLHQLQQGIANAMGKKARVAISLRA